MTNPARYMRHLSPNRMSQGSSIFVCRIVLTPYSEMAQAADGEVRTKGLSSDSPWKSRSSTERESLIWVGILKLIKQAISPILAKHRFETRINQCAYTKPNLQAKAHLDGEKEWNAERSKGQIDSDRAPLLG